MNIAKDQFVKVMNALIAQMERDDEISKSLDNVVEDGANHTLVFRTPLVENIVEALDYDGVISWWLWDGPEHGLKADEFAIILENETRLPIRNAEDLYDYMVKAK